MARNFYYGTDERIVAGSARFASLLSASPHSYGIPEHLAEHYASLDAQLQSAYHAATTPATRTSVAVRNKDELLSQVRRAASNLAQVIFTKQVADAGQLMALGLLPRRKYGRRVLPPEPPVVHVLSVRGRTVKLKIRAHCTEQGRKPLAALGAVIFAHVGEQPPTEPREYHFHGMATRATAEIQFRDEVPSGATAWISVAWVSRRDKQGAACNPVQVTIQGGSIPAAA